MIEIQTPIGKKFCRCLADCFFHDLLYILKECHKQNQFVCTLWMPYDQFLRVVWTTNHMIVGPIFGEIQLYGPVGIVTIKTSEIICETVLNSEP